LKLEEWLVAYFLGIDTSTTSSKALIIDEQGEVIAVSSSPHTLPIQTAGASTGFLWVVSHRHGQGFIALTMRV
jgi:glycerol kinase